MAKTRRRRGGALTDYLSYANPLNWGKSMADIKAAKCAKATAASDAASKTKDEACAGDASADDVEKVADSTAEVAGDTAAPPAPAGQSPPPALGGRSRRRRQTRRKYKGGRHRKGHY